MVRQLATQLGVGGRYGEEFGSTVFVLCAAIVTLSILATMIFMCADGICDDVDSTKPSNAGAIGGVIGGASVPSGGGGGC